MPDKVFIDSNLWIYLYSKDVKGTAVKALVDKHFKHIVISTQILGEMFNVLTRKKIKDKLQAQEIICDLKETFTSRHCTLIQLIALLTYQYVMATHTGTA